jgi:hypothetical protein
VSVRLVNSLESVALGTDVIEDVIDFFFAPGRSATHRPLRQSGNIFSSLFNSSVVATSASHHHLPLLGHKSPFPELYSLTASGGITSGVVIGVAVLP